MAIDNVGLNVIQRVDSSAPRIVPARTGLLGVVGKAYRGKLSVTKCVGEAAVYKKFGTPADNYLYNMVLGARGHNRNTGRFGSELYLTRVVAQDAKVASYPFQPGPGSGASFVVSFRLKSLQLSGTLTGPYVTGDKITVSAPGATDALATLTTVSNNPTTALSEISFTINNPGNFTSIATVSTVISSESGAGLVVSPIFELSSIVPVQAGVNYSNSTVVTLNPALVEPVLSPVISPFYSIISIDISNRGEFLAGTNPVLSIVDPASPTYAAGQGVMRLDRILTSGTVNPVNVTNHRIVEFNYNVTEGIYNLTLSAAVGTSTVTEVYRSPSLVGIANKILGTDGTPSEIFTVTYVTSGTPMVTPISAPLGQAVNTDNFWLQASPTDSRYLVQAGQDNEVDPGKWANSISFSISTTPSSIFNLRVVVRGLVDNVLTDLETFEGSEQSVLNFLASSNYIKHSAADPSNTSKYLPFVDGQTYTLSGGSDGSELVDSDYIGDPVAKTGMYSFEGSPVTSIACMDSESLQVMQALESIATANGWSALAVLPYNISDTLIKSNYSKFLLKMISSLIVYRCYVRVSDGRNGRKWIPGIMHIHGAAYVRWRFQRSLYPNVVLKGSGTFLNDIDALDKEVWSSAEITQYVRELGVNPVVLNSDGFVIEGARTMSTDSRYYSAHILELDNFFISTLKQNLGWLKRELNNDDTADRFVTRVREFATALWNAGCYETIGGFDNNFSVKADIDTTTETDRRQRRFNAVITNRWVEQIESANIFVSRTDDGLKVSR